MSDPGLIASFSPSTIEALRRCGLAVHRRRSRARADRDAPSNPVARLGRAAHRVMEWVAQEANALAANPEREAAIRARWDLEVGIEAAAASHFVVEAANGPVERWPRFATITAGLVVDGAALALELESVPPERRWAERRLETKDGELFGWLDLLIVAEDGASATVIDHKAGAVGPEDLLEGGRYRTQLLLYSALAMDAGFSRVRAELRPLGGAPHSIDVSDGSVSRARAAAKAEVEAYNGAVQTGNVLDVARPSQASCQWCEFLIDCPAVWVAPPPDLGDLHVLEGRLTTVQPGQGNSFAVRLQDDAGRQVTVGGLKRQPVGMPREGQHIRIANLTQSSPDRYRAGAGRTTWSASDEPVPSAHESTYDDANPSATAEGEPLQAPSSHQTDATPSEPRNST